MSKRSPARIPYIPFFGTIAQFQLNTPPVSVLCHPRAVLWARYSAGQQAALYSHCVGRPQCAEGTALCSHCV